MKHLISHFLNHNQEYVLDYSYMNCHVRELHSVALHKSTDGAMVRLYVHTPGGGLIGSLQSNDKPPLAIHDHHCELTLISIHGCFINLNFDKRYDGTPYKSWLYHSMINTGRSGFEQVGVENLTRSGATYFDGEGSIKLPAEQLHTVICPFGNEYASWLVLEGPENPNYKPISYSNNDMSQIDSKELYQRFESIEQIQDLLIKAQSI